MYFEKVISLQKFFEYGTDNNQSKPTAIQVCYALTTENNKREFGGFATFAEDVKVNKKTIITYNQEIQDDNVTVIPAWKYFS